MNLAFGKDFAKELYDFVGEEREEGDVGSETIYFLKAKR
jgi:hypothetical protein